MNKVFKSFAVEPSMQRFTSARRSALARSGQVAAITTRLNDSPHEADNRFYECAQARHADYLVTGNGKHRPKNRPPTKSVNARELAVIS